MRDLYNRTVQSRREIVSKEGKDISVLIQHQKQLVAAEQNCEDTQFMAFQRLLSGRDLLTDLKA